MRQAATISASRLWLLSVAFSLSLSLGVPGRACTRPFCVYGSFHKRFALANALYKYKTDARALLPFADEGSAFVGRAVRAGE